MRVYHIIIHVFGKVQGPTPTGDLHDEYLKNIFECSHKPAKLLTGRDLRSECLSSGTVIIQGTCEMTFDLGARGLHICHILKHWI